MLPALSAGCGREDQITTYRIPTAVPEALVQQDRMLGGIVPAGEKVWFYKLVADVDDVETVGQSFKDWVRQLEYENGAPVLDVPESWKRISPGMMQHAKFQIPAGDRVIEMSVAELGNSGDWNEQVVANVNRWRGQMGLPPETSELAGAEPLELENPPSSQPSVWVSLDGVFAGGASMGGGPPMAGGGPPASGPGATEAPTEAPATEQPDSTDAPAKYAFDLPEGWAAGRSGGMRLAAFDVATDAGAAEVTIIEAGGDMQQNIGMWLSQVKKGGTPEEAEKLAETGEDVEVIGRAGTRFRFFGDEESGKAIDVTMVPLESGSSLFIKMTGEPEAVKAADEPLTEFLRTMRLNE